MLITQPFTAANSPADIPVRVVDTGSATDSGREPQAGAALCLSGGGYRAMLFHVGALWRLYELGQLQTLKRISSVSGGSITAGVLGLKWRQIFRPGGTIEDFKRELVKPIRNLADETIDAESIIGGIFLPGTIADRIAGEYRKHLFGDATLQDLPDDTAPEGSPDHGPRFVINATNVQSGVLWRFSRPYMGDYRVGLMKKPDVPLAVAVGASSAFPPVLSPVVLKLDPERLEPQRGNDLHMTPYTKRAVLTDGGVYDNLGLETAWKAHETVLVSDAGGQMEEEPDPYSDWARHALRVLDLIDNQVRSLRKRQLIDSYFHGTGPLPVDKRRGAYWGIRSDIGKYATPDALDFPFPKSLKLANIATRLKAMPDEKQEALINWGYAVCDAAVRKHVAGIVGPAPKFPYPAMVA